MILTAILYIVALVALFLLSLENVPIGGTSVMVDTVCRMVPNDVIVINGVCGKYYWRVVGVDEGCNTLTVVIEPPGWERV